MSVIKAHAILTAIREVLEDNAGSLRQIPVDRFRGNLPTGLSEQTEMRRALVKPRIAASIQSIERHPQSPPITGNIILYSIGVEVRVVRTIVRLQQLSDEANDTLAALAVEDADYVRQALEYPHNIRGTRATVEGDGTYPTGFVGGETLTMTINGIAVVVTFVAGDTTIVKVVLRIAAAMTAAGVGSVVSASAETVVAISSPTNGSSATVVVTGGTGAATLGLTDATATGIDTDIVSGLLSYVASSVLVGRTIDGGAQPLSTIHSFTGCAKSRPAVAA